MLQLNSKFINYKEKSREEKRSITEDIKHAVTVEHNKMAISLNDCTIETLRKKTENENITEIEKQAIIEKIQTLEEENKTFSEIIEKFQDAYDRTVSIISTASKEYTDPEGKTQTAMNNKNATRNLLRILAATDDRRFYKIAVVSQIDYSKFYDVLSKVHSMNEECFDACGKRKTGKADAALYKDFDKKLSDEIQKLFSLPVENRYTMPIRIKFNRKTLAYLHESFNSGAKVVIDHKKNKFKGLEMNTIIKPIYKNGEIKDYDGDKFKELLTKLVVEYMIEKNGKGSEYWID